jgi:hypothetical protein
LSPSLSPSISLSVSPSVSPSIVFPDYTRGEYASPPINNNDLSTAYSAQDYSDVSADDDKRVGQTATSDYAIHQFKDYINSAGANFYWKGQTNCAPTLSAVYLQIYNKNTSSWENLAFDNSSTRDVDFILTANKTDLTNYKDINGGISCRVYQLDI